MPICAQCGRGYEVTERVCPSCGAPPGITAPRCGPVAMVALRIAWGAAFLAVIVGLVGGVVALIRREWVAGILLIFIITPIAYGQHVALGLAIRYAEGSD